jgi:hypothetical protein
VAADLSASLLVSEALNVRVNWLKEGIPSAGLYAGAVAWSANTQAGYSLVSWACAHDARILFPLLALIFAVASGIGAFASWRAVSAPRSANTAASRLLARIGVLSACLFALAIILQGIASLVLTGCER